MTNQLRKEVLQSYKRCLQVTHSVFKHDPENINYSKIFLKFFRKIKNFEKLCQMRDEIIMKMRT